eukprot:NODE_641_length_2510_cov_64.026812_g548_i0.p1 GENE.NODE_641_length_2510_cov_64.026812_g548_i0~~NODE_641_length_2510_cov_64.026812_g548_i0.p1  ORF type:complete len:684 (-),score=121.91 NODE_641_length_2510_cov_64.026812_g548_i0:392-2443(-)
MILLLLFVNIVYCLTTEKPAYNSKCLQGFSQNYIESCDEACDCEYGYCKKCCQLSSGKCRSHEPLGWIVKGDCKTCPKGYTLDVFDASPCESHCKLYLDNPSSNPSCCSAVPKQGSSSFSCFTKPLENCKSNNPPITTTNAAPSLPSSYVFKSSPILGQGSCGDCYVFSAVQTMADRINPKINFSPQPYTTCGQPSGCSGGVPTRVMKWHLSKGITVCDSNCLGGCHPFFSSNGNPVATAVRACPTGYRETASGIPSWCAIKAGCDPKTGDCPTKCVKYISSGSCSWTTKHIGAPLYKPCLKNSLFGDSNEPSNVCSNGRSIDSSNSIELDGYTVVSYSDSENIASSRGGRIEAKKPSFIVENQLKREIFSRGSISSCYKVKDGFKKFFRNNPTGVYDLRAWNSDPDDGSGHCVRTVGWGVSSSGMSYWLAANSWGPHWGDNGFFRIQSGANVADYESRGTSWIIPTPKSRDRKMKPEAVDTPVGTAEKVVSDLGGGEWDDDDNENAGYEVIDYLMRQKDAFDNADTPPNSNVHELVEINNVQKQIVDGVFQIRVDFDTKSKENEFYNHVNVVRVTDEGLQRKGRPVAALMSYGPANPISEGKPCWGDRPGSWKPWAGRQEHRVYHFIDGEVRIEKIQINRKPSIIAATGLIMVCGLVALALFLIRKKRTYQQTDDVFVEMES